MRKINRLRRDVQRDSAMEDLFGELSDMRTALCDAYERFNVTVEPELVDACVYEINAIQSRYNYLLRLIKEQGGEAAFKAYSGEVGAVWV